MMDRVRAMCRRIAGRREPAQADRTPEPGPAEGEKKTEPHGGTDHRHG